MLARHKLRQTTVRYEYIPPAQKKPIHFNFVHIVLRFWTFGDLISRNPRAWSRGGRRPRLQGPLSSPRTAGAAPPPPARARRGPFVLSLRDLRSLRQVA